MKVIPRLIPHQEAEILARTVVTRTSVKGRIECHGLSWKCDALLEWENRQRDLGLEPKVDVRIDELDLSVVFVDVPDRSVGPFRAISRQPSFTEGLSLFELRKLKESIKDKELADRLGRLDDKQAMGLRVDYFEALGHRNDPVAKKRLSDRMNEMVRLRLAQVPSTNAPPEPTPMPKAPAPAKERPRKKNKASSPTSPAPQPPATPDDYASRLAAEPTSPASPSSAVPKNGGFPTSKIKTIQLKRKTHEH